MRFLEEGQEQEPGQLHGTMVTIVWLAAANIGIWSQAFKHYNWSTHVHFYTMSIVTFITWVSGIMALTQFGLHSEVGDFHTGLGIAIMAVLLLQSIGGMACWTLQKEPRVKMSLIPIASISHKILGWILLLLTVIQFCVIGKTALYLTISLISWGLFFLYKGYRIIYSKMENDPQLYLTKKDKDILVISQFQELTKYKGNYFIFADKVYDIDKVITNHPGGYQFINRIRGREVDRYLYGSEPLESAQSQRVHSHSSDSIKLAGDPIGILASVCPFSNMEQLNQVILDKLVLMMSSSYIFAVYLIAKSDKKFRYTGYEHLSQIGKYYTVTINEKKTRLYTMVNFLHRQNIDLMQKITGIKYKQKISNQQTNQSLNQISGQLKLDIISYQYQSIPLLIKKYDDGWFTSDLLSSQFKGTMQLSRPLGKGMSLHEMPNGKIIMFAAGTGLHPYCDLIDLLFKEMIVELKNIHLDQIVKKNPIVKKKELKTKFTYCLYLSVRSIDDIHLMTVQQLDQLSRNKVMKVHLLVRSQQSDFFKRFSHIKKSDQRFENYMLELSKEIDLISQIYICGPPAMSKSMVTSLQNLNVPDRKFRVL